MTMLTGVQIFELSRSLFLGMVGLPAAISPESVYAV